MSCNKPILGYWNIRGLCNPIRFMLAYLNVDYEEKIYNVHKGEEWLAVKGSLDLEFPNIPYWLEGDIRMTESQAILKHIARTYGPNLIPKTEEKLRKAEMIEGFSYDITHILLWSCFFIEDALRAQNPYLDKRSEQSLQKLSQYIGKNPWVLGDEISYVDFWVYELLYLHNQYNPSWVQSHSNLVSYKERFEKLDGIAKYMNSPNYVKAPCNSPSAKHPFGQN